MKTASSYSLTRMFSFIERVGQKNNRLFRLVQIRPFFRAKARPVLFSLVAYKSKHLLPSAKNNNSVFDEHSPRKK